MAFIIVEDIFVHRKEFLLLILSDKEMIRTSHEKQFQKFFYILCMLANDASGYRITFDLSMKVNVAFCLIICYKKLFVKS